MDLVELVNIGADKVRANSDLMHIYIDEYERIFGVKPNCVSCSFRNDFNRLRDFVLYKEKGMNKKEITFKYKEPKGDILTYYNGDTPIRRYDNNLTEEFVIDFLTYGSEEQLEERRKLFSVLPADLKVVNNEGNEEINTDLKVVNNEGKSKSNRTTQKKGRVK